MSTATTESSKKPQSKPKTKEKRQGQIKASGTERLKTIVRRLPPNLPEHIFWQSVQPWVTDDTVLWKEFYPGKSRKRQNKEDVHSRAYIAFKTEEYVAKFSREYDGHIFKDKAGNESRAVVEFAPYQKLPLEKKKVDTRNATVDQDEEYIAFLQSLETLSTKPYDTDQLLEMLVASTERPSMPASTPLLDALKAEKSAQRDKEAIQRNHPHYKDAAQASKKEESKKKAAAAAAATAATAKQSGDSAAPLGKRAAKRAAAAAAQKASAQTSAPPPPKAGGAPAVSSTTKPPPSPNKSKSTRASKHHASAQAQSSKLSSAPLDPATQVAAASNTPAETGAGASAPAPAPAAAAGSNETGRRTRPVLGLASRQFEVALSGAGVSKGSRRDRGAEKEKEAAKDGLPREKKDGGSRKNKEEDAPARNPVLVPQPGVLPAPTILQREAKPPPPPRQSQQAPSDASAAIPSGRSGKRGRGRGRGGNRDRGAPPPPADS
ncbi:Smg-4/UPF3 family-domain-containing protein [Lactarius hengduanensis]|nr:Smg-4/UPF3 family-domain-containing protein [Lactarius hengduanensis]